MSYEELTPVDFVVRRVPDHSLEPNADGGRDKVELPGMFEAGFVLDGVFKATHHFKAAGLLADIERAKAESKSKKSGS